jgi:hypothetical protein
MKTKKLIASSFFISLFLFVNLALALPCAFFGEVTLDGSLTNGTYVEAYYLNGTFISKGKEPADGFGHYSIAVNAPDENITLKIKGISVEQGIQFCESGEPNYLNISATTPLPTITTTTVQQSNSGGGGGGNGYYYTTTTKPSVVTTTVISQVTTTTEEEKACLDGCSSNETVVTTTIPYYPSVTGAFLTGIGSLLYWLIPIIILMVLLIILFIRKMDSTKNSSSTHPDDSESTNEFDETTDVKISETKTEEITTESTPEDETQSQ